MVLRWRLSATRTWSRQDFPYGTGCCTPVRLLGCLWHSSGPCAPSAFATGHRISSSCASAYTQVSRFWVCRETDKGQREESTSRSSCFAFMTSGWKEHEETIGVEYTVTSFYNREAGATTTSSMRHPVVADNGNASLLVPFHWSDSLSCC